ncbi:MAG: LysM peptidoglycan-binding domain-containing protein [Chloroflexi bacterium]|nr:LysM peptidoglycan-binding domain-containing protein [Chloroflexota bacterium]
MQHVRRLLIVALVVMLVVPSLATLAQDGDGQRTEHTVQAGENLYRISLQYGTTIEAIALANNISNPNLIRTGQVLAIPSSDEMPPQPPVTGEIVHVVQPGENLFRISLQYNLLTAIVAQYNGITTPSLIFVGQEIRIPPPTALVMEPQVQTAPLTQPPDAQAETQPEDASVADDAQATTESDAGTETEAAPIAVEPIAPTGPVESQAETVGFAYGLHIYLPNQDMPQVLESAGNLNVTWVKQDIEWGLYEPSAGNINWEPLDAMVDAMDEAGFNILLTVSGAPTWARDTSVDKGPPTDYQTFANFMGELATRYAGVVDAYEIWDEPNLQRSWTTARGLSAADYVALLGLSYNAIKQADPAAIVVSAGLAPTGVNDGVGAIDDRVYLHQMYAAGLADFSDAIGAHPNGWANPPDSTCCRNLRPTVPGWDDHPSFFFQQTLNDYREIMRQNDDGGTYIWATEFGWGSNDGLNITPPESLGFVEFTTMDEQAQYVTRAFQLGSELGYVGPMFVWNLNLCQVVGVSGEQCLWGLLDPAGNPRPAYLALQAMMQEE